MRRRIRALRAARTAIEWLVYALALATIVVLGAKSGRITDAVARRALWLAALIPVAAAVVSALRRIRRLQAAQLLDKAHGLHDRLSNALAFGEIPRSERTPMMQAAIDDAAERVRSTPLSTRRALAWHWPAELKYVAALAVALALVSGLEVRERVVHRVRAPAHVERDPLVLADDDLDAFRDFARGLEPNARTEEGRRALERFQRFVDDIANRRLDRQDAYRQLSELQAALESDRENDREALRDALRQMGDRLDTESTRPLAEAMRQADPRAAAEAMRQLAEQLRQNRLDPQQRQDLQRALQRATDQRNQQDLEQQVRRAREEVERLLRQQRERQLNQPEQRLLQQRQRELERLSRDQQRREEQRRQLERLTRNMSQAMQDLLRDLGQAAQDLEQGAEDLNRMQNEELNEQQMQELRQALEDLRQRMRQQNGQGGQQQRMRLMRFAGQARGGVMPGGMQPGGLRLFRSRGGGGIPLPGQGQGPAQGQQGQGDPSQQGTGSQAGTEHDEHLRGARTNINARMQTVNVAGQQRGAGPGRSVTIRTAAQQGFTSEAYRDVHAEYWQRAREVVHAGEVPPGYRSYVRRYFQLIRPRD